MLILLVALAPLSAAFAGGIVTNTNQSAAYVRTMSRDASTDIDAVFYNPAGLVKLPEGLHVSLNNQTILQKKYIESGYQYLNESEYIGDVTVPFFPGVYAAYKTGKFAFSLGYNPVGGGGSATYETGLPSFETGISDLVPLLSAQGVEAYTTDIYFKGTSVYTGLQAGASFAVTDNIAIFAGARYIMARNTYEGHIQDNTLYFIEGAPVAQMLAYDYFAAAEAQYTQAGDLINAAQMRARKLLLADQTADVVQRGTSVTPVFGLNLSFLDDKLNIGLKYEPNTSLEIENETVEGKGVLISFTPEGEPVYKYPDGQKYNTDIPAFLSVGLSYDITEKLNAAVGFHSFFDKQSDWDGRQDSVESNFMELALGFEYAVNENFTASVGYMQAITGVGEGFQTDISHSLTSGSLGFGAKYALTPALDLNAGFLYTFYTDDEVTRTHILPAPPTYPELPANEKYSRTNMVFAVGLDFHLFAK